MEYKIHKDTCQLIKMERKNYYSDIWFAEVINKL